MRLLDLKSLLWSILLSFAVMCPLANTEDFHSADQDTDNVIALGELLRVIQLFNFGELSCDPTLQSEDEFLAGSEGTQSCTPHSSDYGPQDWSISMSELLRFIQFYNSCGYSALTGSEDGFIAIKNLCRAITELIPVAEGTFPMGIGLLPGQLYQQHDVTLSAYAIGKYEITNQQFVDALNWANEIGYLESITADAVSSYGQILLPLNSMNCCLALILYNGVEFSVGERNAGVNIEKNPVDNVSWYGAVAFCNWLSEREGLDLVYDTTTWEADFSRNGYRLPTEAEWERAASWDGSAKWTYGNSSDTISCSSANIGLDQGQHCKTYTTQVGYFNGINISTINSQSPVGCYDMSGNTWEWCHDWYDSDYYAVSPTNDPTGPAMGIYRVVRGGNWLTQSDSCRTFYRGNGTPSNPIRGFRVARRLLP